MFPRRFPWLRTRRGCAVPLGWVVRDIRTGRYWADPYGLRPTSGDPRSDWRPRKRAYVFVTRRVAEHVAHERGVTDRVIVVPASEHQQHTGGRARPELGTSDDGEPLRPWGVGAPPPRADTCTVQLIVRLIAECN